MNKTKNSYEIRFFSPTCTVFSKQNIKSHLLSATCKFYFHIFLLFFHNMGPSPQLCSVISLHQNPEGKGVGRLLFPDLNDPVIAVVLCSSG